MGSCHRFAVRRERDAVSWLHHSNGIGEKQDWSYSLDVKCIGLGTVDLRYRVKGRVKDCLLV